MLRPVRVTPPAATPVSLTEAKAHLRVDHDEDDTLITALVGAATGHLDGWSGVLGRCLVSQVWRQSFEDFTGHVLRLPLPDVSAVASVTYRDADNAEQTIASASYALHEDALSAFLFFDNDYSFPELYRRPDALTVQFTVGYGDAAAVPAAIKAAMLLHVGHLYENREAVTLDRAGAELPMGYDTLIAPYRVRRL